MYYHEKLNTLLSLQRQLLLLLLHSLVHTENMSTEIYNIRNINMKGHLLY